MKTKKLNFIIMAMAVIMVSANYSCKKSTDTPIVPPATGIQLTANTKFGNILTDNNGRSLYFFSMDASGNSACTGGCILTWQPLTLAAPTIGAGLAASDFATITRDDGSKQSTYKGWPLYYYAKDTNAGDVLGDAVGGTWFIGKADYTVMIANAQLLGRDGVEYTSLSKPGQEISQYITDANGRTLYAYAPDKFKKNNYTKSDFSNDAIWPVYTINTVQNIPSILDKTQFDVITIFGKTQLVYKGWPLYYFGADAGLRGSTKGVSVPTAGVWPITNLNTNVAPLL
jgi:predicted lipoprotein with Yx(FWY)xxD motif